MKILTFLVMVICMFMIAESDRAISMPSEATGWKWDTKEMKYNSKTLFEYMDGAAELYLAYGFQNLTVRRFERPNHPPIILECYELASSGDAYGVFTFERQDEPAGIGQGSEFGGGLLRFWKGKFFVSIYADGQGPDVESAILRLGQETADSIPERGREPELVSFIPGKDFGLIDPSVRYVRSHVLLNQRFFISHENILNLDRESEAVLAQYLRDKHKVQLLLIRYPTLPKAEAAYQRFMKSYMPDSGGKDRLKTEDGKWTFARRHNEWMVVIFGAPTEGDGEVLLKDTKGKLPQAH